LQTKKLFIYKNIFFSGFKYNFIINILQNFSISDPNFLNDHHLNRYFHINLDSIIG